MSYILLQIREADRQIPNGTIAYILGFSEEEFGAMQNDAAIKAFGYSPARFILVGLDDNIYTHIENLKMTGALKDHFFFRYSNGRLLNQTDEFRKDPESIMTMPQHADPDAPVPRFVHCPEVQLFTPKEIEAGKGVLTLRVVNLDAQSIDVLYTLNGVLHRPVTNWRLDSDRFARVFVGQSTPKGAYHIVAIRDSFSKNRDEWVSVDAFVFIR